MTVRIAVIYYSATGNVARLAEALAEGAATVDAEVRLRRAAELAPESAIDSNPTWRAYYDESASAVAEARVENLEWADGFAFGTPTRFGNGSSQLKQFIDQTGPSWMADREGEHDPATRCSPQPATRLAAWHKSPDGWLSSVPSAKRRSRPGNDRDDHPGRSSTRGPRNRCVLCRRSHPERVLHVPLWRSAFGARRRLGGA